MTDLTVVVPTRNEAGNVEPLLTQLDHHLRGLDAEVVFVDDSSDDTPAVIAEVAARVSIPVRLEHRSEPTGRLAGAVVHGLRASTSPWVVVMDGDLQHPPELVPVLHAAAVSRASDVVVASRYLAGGSAAGLSSAARRLVSSWSGRAAKLLFPRRLARCSDPMSGFFAVRPASLDLDAVTQRGYKILLSLLVHRRLRVDEVSFVFADRNAGESKASLREGFRYLGLLASLRTGRGLQFAAVGASGVLPNVAAVALLTGLGVNYLVAGAVATQLAILWNFAGAELVVFRDRRAGRLGHRLLRYLAVSEVDLLRLPFVALLVHGLGLGSVVATVVTLVGAVALRYGLATRLVYGATAAAGPAAPVTPLVTPLAAPSVVRPATAGPVLSEAS